MNTTLIVYKPNCRKHTESGFSLIELTVVMMVVIVVVGMSVLQFGKARMRYRLTQQAESIVGQIERARSLAIKHNQTLTLGFSSENTLLELTCSDCLVVKSELPAYRLPGGVKLSAYPTITIKGNGTIATTDSAIVASDAQGRQVTISISNSGRTKVSAISDQSAGY
jgi:type II secretory pathway pseudopilin PulG